MIEFGGITYYIDIMAVSELVTPNPNPKQATENTTLVETKVTTDNNGDKTTVVTEQIIKNPEIENKGIKYDMIKNLIDMLLDDDSELEDSLGAERALSKTSLGFKIAFNTLLKFGILKQKKKNK